MEHHEEGRGISHSLARQSVVHLQVSAPASECAGFAPARFHRSLGSGMYPSATMLGESLPLSQQQSSPSSGSRRASADMYMRVGSISKIDGQSRGEQHHRWLENVEDLPATDSSTSARRPAKKLPLGLPGNSYSCKKRPSEVRMLVQEGSGSPRCQSAGASGGGHSSPPAREESGSPSRGLTRAGTEFEYKDGERRLSQAPPLICAPIASPRKQRKQANPLATWLQQSGSAPLLGNAAQPARSSADRKTLAANPAPAAWRRMQKRPEKLASEYTMRMKAIASFE
eukprot:gnl/TRDRNA2_/TRDRNA2_182997_c0_seq1.p1 gnl/TRDRNA2_/TRDRNA2_182997_c0~~gnl/TRDRNA2_/TRDRNA2_182997_c0_seq1.p1  ORF type:complete len:284 (-),score=46.81 gnl/TRDRNA2_/TRDRNA2_182997_c0_seq1:55-906(-)